MKLQPYVIKRIAALVQANNHGEAIVEAAYAIGRKDLAERVESINRRHCWLGHLPPMLYEERRTIRQKLTDYARRVLHPADYRRFTQAI